MFQTVQFVIIVFVLPMFIRLSSADCDDRPRWIIDIGCEVYDTWWPRTCTRQLTVTLAHDAIIICPLSGNSNCLGYGVRVKLTRIWRRSGSFYSTTEQEANHKVGVGETPSRLIRKLCRYSSPLTWRCSVSPIPVATTTKITPDSESPPTVCYWWLVNTIFCRISHHFRVISLFLHFWPILRTFLSYLIAVCSRPEGTGDAISDRFVRPLVLNKHVKFDDPNLNRSREIPPKAVGGGIFDLFPL